MSINKTVYPIPHVQNKALIIYTNIIQGCDLFELPFISSYFGIRNRL